MSSADASPSSRAPVSTAEQKKSPLHPCGALTLGVKKLLSTGLYSDLTIVCGGKEFKVHRAILHPQSSVFAKLLSGNFKKSHQAVIEVDDDSDVFQVLCHYLYHFVYSDSSRGDEQIAPFAVRVYAIADKYDVKPLQELAAMKLTTACKPAKSIDEFITTICTVDQWCNPEDSTLWDIIVPKITENIHFLLQNEKFKSLLLDLPSLNFSLLARIGPRSRETGRVYARRTGSAQADIEFYRQNGSIGDYSHGHRLGES